MDRQLEIADAAKRAEKLVTLSQWPPDVFAALVDILAVDGVWQTVQNEFINAERDPLKVRDPEVQVRMALNASATRVSGTWQVSDALRTRALAAIGKARAWRASAPDAIPDADDFPREIAYLARAIDAEAVELSLYGRELLSKKFNAVSRRLAMQGTLTRYARGRVIPTAAHSAWGNSPQKFFLNLLRIHPGEDRFVDYELVASIPRRGSGAPLLLGFIPTVQYQEEVTWSLQGNHFAVGLNPKHETVVIERVMSGLKWLVKNGADIVVIPELVSCAALRGRVCEWLRDEVGEKPLFVACGSEAIPSKAATGWTNRAFVYGPSGRILWEQDKHHQYKMDGKNIERLGLTPVLGAQSLNEIGASTRSRVVIRDIRGAGRFCVLVCEDFARASPGQAAIRAFQVDMAIVIVMDGPFPVGGWRKRNAVNLAQEPGARTAIANSRAVLSRLPPEESDKAEAKIAELAYYCLPNQAPIKTRTWPGRKPVKDSIALLIAPREEL
jgi:hypothetical protein